jgi:uncharacterized 2Fe-2S/4Fe-4S cluster protein (DUF4445 family)
MANKIVLDIGTSTLCGCLIDQQARVVKQGVIPNSQKSYGSDILTRLTRAVQCDEDRQGLHRSLTASIDRMIEILGGEAIEEIVAVGNPAMYVFLYDLNPGPLCAPPYNLPVKESPGKNARNLGIGLDAPIWMGPPIHGFVGSDAVAGIFSHLLNGPKPSLLMDMGTNCELVLSTGEGLWVTSVPGGPAFEESHIHCGLSAGSGGVYRARLEDGRWRFQTTDNDEPGGLCASGIIDVIASLLNTGQIHKSGKISAGTEIILEPHHRLKISQKDIRSFQLSKASIRAGIDTVLQRAGVALNGLERIILTGAFGGGVSIENCRTVGLIPNVPVQKVEVDKAGPLGGAVLLAAVDDRRGLFEKMGRCKSVHLPLSPFFQQSFKKNLTF